MHAGFFFSLLFMHIRSFFSWQWLCCLSWIHQSVVELSGFAGFDLSVPLGAHICHDTLSLNDTNSPPPSAHVGKLHTIDIKSTVKTQTPATLWHSGVSAGELP